MCLFTYLYFEKYQTVKTLNKIYQHLLFYCYSWQSINMGSHRDEVFVFETWVPCFRRYLSLAVRSNFLKVREGYF